MSIRTSEVIFSLELFKESRKWTLYLELTVHRLKLKNALLKLKVRAFVMCELFSLRANQSRPLNCNPFQTRTVLRLHSENREGVYFS